MLNTGMTKILRLKVKRVCVVLTMKNNIVNRPQAISQWIGFSDSEITDFRSSFIDEIFVSSNVRIKPETPTPKSHHAKEDPKSRGGKEKIEPRENMGMNKPNPKDPQIAKILQSLSEPCIVLVLFLFEMRGDKSNTISDVARMKPINAMKLIVNAESR